MGYYTRYGFEVSASVDENIGPNEEEWMLVNGHFHKIVGCTMQEIEEEQTKWYDHEEHMRALSIRFPTFLFTVTGDGEEQGDQWIKYFVNGKMQEARAQITFDRFTKDKLK